MTDRTTNMDTCPASESECSKTHPRLLNSRRKHHRQLYKRNSEHYKRLEHSWRKRRERRIRESDYPELSSADERELPPHVTASGALNRAFLRHMPRPSDIVPAIEEGCASDAGFDPKARQIHKRRKEALRIMLACLNSKGEKLPVPSWKRKRAGLDKYTMYMAPPQEDLNLPDMRVPLPLLSKYYRGSLLAVHRVGRPTKTRKNQKADSTSPTASAFECEYLGTSSQSDFEVNRRHASVKNEPEEMAGNLTASGPVAGASGFSKAAFLEELENVAGGSSDGLSDADIERIGTKKMVTSDNVLEGVDQSSRTSGHGETNAPAKSKGPSASQTASEAPKEAPKKSEIDLFREMLTQNPELLFADVKPKIDVEEAVVDNTVQKTIDEEQGETELTPFQKEQRIARLFSHGAMKRPRSTANEMRGRYLNPPKRRRHSSKHEAGYIANGSGSGGSDPRMNLKFAMKVMSKMGFTGRLGKKEDGRTDPVLPTHHSFRSGLGSRPAEVPANRTADRSLIPKDFTGKAQESGDRSASSRKQASHGDIPPNGTLKSPPSDKNFGSDDVFTRRRKSSAVPLQTGTDSSIVQGQKTKAGDGHDRLPAEVDEDDIYEPDDNSEGIDNGRRAILVDYDVLVRNSAERRVKAFEKMLKDASLNLNASKVLAEEERDLCDDDLLRKVLGFANVKPNNMAQYKDKLDEAFEAIKAPEVDIDLVDTLRLYSKDVHFGIFHRGSRRRMQDELRATGLANSFLHDVCATVKNEDVWPYVDTWQDLMCRVGVGQRQCLFLLDEGHKIGREGEKRPGCGIVAGSCLGSQTAVWTRTEDGVSVHVKGNTHVARVLKIKDSSAQIDRKKAFDELLKDRMSPLRRRRVLAQYEEDLLWYSAVVHYESEDKCWVKFNKFDNTNWILNEELVSLSRKDFRNMKKMDFPGLIDADASVL